MMSPRRRIAQEFAAIADALRSAHLICRVNEDIHPALATSTEAEVIRIQGADVAVALTVLAEKLVTNEREQERGKV